MAYIFIELYNFKPAWVEQGEEGRIAFAKGVTGAVDNLTSMGVEVLGYGMNDTETAHRSPYEFFCVYRVPNKEFQREFEAQVEAAGWYEFFEQINTSGEIVDHAEALLAQARLGKP
jgi:Family of unknown function (DUF6616)